MSKYLARIKDGAILKQNEDGTYSFMHTGMHRPYRYRRDGLSSEHFEEVTEEDFPRMRLRGEEYYAYIDWCNRSDGHGGIKGGTIEEFRVRNLK